MTGGHITTTILPTKTADSMWFRISVMVAMLPTIIADERTVCPGWPPPAVTQNFSRSLKGDMVFDGEVYKEATKINNIRFDSRFSAVVMVEDADDVIKAVKFAEANKLPITVLSSGHSYVGRSAGHCTFNINLSRMKQMTVNLNDSESDTGSSITVGTGNSWGDIYKKVDEYGKVVVGGSAQTVSPGGYTLGGGHSPLTRALGLGVDSVVKIMLVTASGEHLEVNYHSNSVSIINIDGSRTSSSDFDLQWALLGGGHGFGIVTSYTIKMHDAPKSLTYLYMLYPISSNLTGPVGKQILERVSDVILNDLTPKWGGYVILTNDRVDVKLPPPQQTVGIHIDGFITISMLHFGPRAEAMPGIERLLTYRPDLYGQTLSIREYSTFWEYEKNINDATGFRQYIGNRFVQREDLQNPSRFAESMVNILDYPHGAQCTGTLIGGKATEMASDEESASPKHESAVSPDFRSSFISLSCGTGWGFPIQDCEYIKSFNCWMQNNLYKIGRGTYPNEPDYYLKNWQQDFWGPSKRYARLLRAKKRYDPNGVFSCHQCVGAPKQEGKQECGEMPEYCPVAAGSAPSPFNMAIITQVILSVMLMHIVNHNM